MELIIFFLVIVTVLALFNLAALRWGADSRHTTSDWQPRSDYEL